MIPRGIEILVKKASVDSEFRRHLLTERADAAVRIGLELTIAEVDMLSSIPQSQLIAIIGSTRVSPRLRPAFMGYAAAAMLATFGGFATVSLPATADDSPHSEAETETKLPKDSEPTTTVTAEYEESTSSYKSGSVSGLVADQNGAGVPGALIVVKGANLFATSSTDGYFVIGGVPTGKYDVKASRVGFSEMTSSGIRVMDGLRTNISFHLNSSIVGCLGIRADSPEIKKDITEKNREVESEDIENQTRDDIDDFIKLVPGVVYE